jgi:hypothetical protein
VACELATDFSANPATQRTLSEAERIAAIGVRLITATDHTSVADGRRIEDHPVPFAALLAGQY